ncbi:hypothetical protein LRP49_03725 [Enterovibrio sp. ZSDZ35]|uniref:Uncharacterized protein n=1 Tax=Enterovibrio qingdaonensis TaxID=2899818 RepID=A0ABT5QI01_9GAMM|nr:hypothetical protein [Enterovibrio sp. ZSDZ35]MDD1780303.1 hypothetical protein [Enterovibrio sp. ZSDZ35]
MKVGLKLDANVSVSKLHISQVVTFDNSFNIYLSNGHTLTVVREVDSEHFQDCIEVPVNEYHRIQRELSEYLGIEIEDANNVLDQC